ncbi:autoinducer binding domain-containing protein [Mesorhizobium sp. WSM2561]|uniref:autoinducer binding domain-containing protein n=1 Tax=Mesorhizobium sp. WSM2561 TaxID=1040985 RepID=UPI0004B92DAA|nr:autoinducer binding domain-containing protein [Mesorhizobium sp. WSM2561]
MSISLGPEHSRTGLSKFEQQLFDEAAEFGIRCGLTIPIVDRRGCVTAMTFAAAQPNPAFLSVAERYEQALQLMATCFHISALRACYDAHDRHKPLSVARDAFLGFVKRAGILEHPASAMKWIAACPSGSGKVPV